MSFVVPREIRLSSGGFAMLMWCVIGTLLMASGLATTAWGDAWDPGDNTGATGTWLTPTSTTQSHGPHTLDTSDWYDWYRINMAAGTTYHFDTVGGSGDDYGQLYSNAAGTLLVVSNDDSGGGLQFSFNYTAAATQTYYLRVRRFSETSSTATWSGSLYYSTVVLPPSPTVTVTSYPSFVTAGASYTVTWDISGGTSVTHTNVHWGMSSGVVSSFGSTYSGAPGSYSDTLTAPSSGTIYFFINSWIDGPTYDTGEYSIPILNSAQLNATLETLPALVSPGEWFAVILTVTNTGGANATGVIPALQINAGASLVSLQSGPLPSGPVMLAPGSSQTFTWTYSASGAGIVALTGTATGTDSATGNPISSNGVSTSLLISSLETALSVSSSPMVASQDVTVVLTVTNVGNAEVTGVWPALQVNSPALVALQSGPTPAGPVTLAPGASQTFTWLYAVTGVGTVSFTATAVGMDSGAGILVMRSTDSVVPARFVVVSVTDYPGQAPAGATYVVTWDVASGGVLTHTNIHWGTSSGGYTYSSAPSSGGTGVYSVTVTAPVSGTIYFVAHALVGGTSYYSSEYAIPVSSPVTTPPPIVKGPAQLVADVSVSPAPALVGQTLTIALTVTNTGEVTATAVTPSLQATVGAAMVRYQSGPVPSGGKDLDAGAALTFVWQYQVEQAGNLTLTGNVTGTDSVSGLEVATQAQVAITLTRKFSEAIVAFPNPATGDRLNVALSLQGDAAEVEVEIFDAGFLRVFGGQWLNVSQAEGLVVVEGISKLTPGLYLMRVHAKLTGGGVQKFPLVRVVINR